MEDSGQLAEKLMTTIPMCPEQLQKEIIAVIPEIVDDAQHPLVVHGLMELVDTDAQFMVPVLDALSNLSLSMDVLEDVRKKVLRSLDSSKIQDLPVIVRFLLQSAESPEAATQGE
eukprot:TRINITY_DN1688_c0_g1_i3.p2 TRINITY_DN1688_c0_g1~~TRINITY_DN1688_c0_g1_i3.p2  ORF type:complete len:115 (-),score=48.67 TRINITY_DN1688_c0_g1_i3:697-1041(-)